jgi:hypothetical protein
MNITTMLNIVILNVVMLSNDASQRVKNTLAYYETIKITVIKLIIVNVCVYLNGGLVKVTEIDKHSSLLQQGITTVKSFMLQASGEFDF